MKISFFRLLQVKLAFTLMLLLVLVSCKRENDSGKASAPQEPQDDFILLESSEEFREACAPIKTALDSPQPYDLEKTVQVMYALEQLQTNAVQLDDFLMGMAKMNQNSVAKDVLDSEVKLLKVLLDMRNLEQETKELKELTLYHSVVNAARNTNNALDSDSISSIAGLNIVSLVTIAPKQAITQGFDEVDRYLDAQKAIKKKFRQEMNELKQHYLTQLTEYTPICEKYMKEWDTLCNEKDRAYLDIYHGHFANALKTTERILSKYPLNRETLILQALSNTMLGMQCLDTDAMHLAPLAWNNFTDGHDEIQTAKTSDYFAKAKQTLDIYMKEYTDFTAPAFVLLGMIALCENNPQEGLGLLDKASIEYPRQAEKLTSMFELYKGRSYLNKTLEGKYLLRLYRSTMEGYGIFSPNFIKAGYFTQCNKDEESRREIFNHFFRRGNQGVYHCLLSDMLFCDKFISGSFRHMLPENSFFDIETSKAVVGKNKIKVTVNNRTNISLQNVRVFLCLHLTDMYTDEYEIVKVPTKNLIPAMERTNLETVEFNYEGKTYDDIAHIRAIVMTDDAICWIDNVDYKLDKARSGAGISNARSDEQIERNLLLSGFDIQTLQDTIYEKTVPIFSTVNTKGLNKYTKKLTSLVTGNLEKQWQQADGQLKFEIPRALTLMAPSFALRLQSGEILQPEISFINESKIRLMFDIKPTDGEEYTLYIYSKYVNCRLILECKENTMQIEKCIIF